MASTLFEGGLQIRFASRGHFEVTVSMTPVSLPNLTSLEHIRRVVIRPLGADIIFTDDGSTPSGSHGLLLLENEILIYDGQDPSAFKMVRRGSVDADVRVAYYGT
jgi:hypothetical protein